MLKGKFLLIDDDLKLFPNDQKNYDGKMQLIMTKTTNSNLKCYSSMVNFIFFLHQIENISKSWTSKMWKAAFGHDISWISFTFSWLAGYCQTDSGVSDVEMFLPSKSDVNKLTNPYQIRIQQRCDRIENHFVHNSLVSFSNYVSIVKLHTFAIYSANDDFCFFMKKRRK